LTILAYTSAILTIKMIFLFQYYRILGLLLPRYVYMSIVVAVGAWSTAMVLQCFFLCQPLAGFWDKTLPEVKCLPDLSTWLGGAVGNILTDLVVFALPIPMLSKLNLPGVQKAMLIGVFSLGFLTIALSVVRIKYLRLNEDDVSWSNVSLTCLSMSELTLGIISACVPTMRRLFFRPAQRMLTVHASEGDSIVQRRHGEGSVSNSRREWWWLWTRRGLTGTERSSTYRSAQGSSAPTAS
jgi:hypothetical protein